MGELLLAREKMDPPLVMVDQLVLVLAQDKLPHRISSLIYLLKHQKLQERWLSRIGRFLVCLLLLRCLGCRASIISIKRRLRSELGHLLNELLDTHDWPLVGQFLQALHNENLSLKQTLQLSVIP